MLHPAILTKSLWSDKQTRSVKASAVKCAVLSASELSESRCSAEDSGHYSNALIVIRSGVATYDE